MGDSVRDDIFHGEHFEGMGGAWNAIFGESESISDWLPTIAQEGKMRPTGLVHYKAADMLVAMYEYPALNGTRVGMLTVQESGEASMAMWSCSPLLDGIANKLVIDRQHTWENGVEGVVAAHEESDGAPVTFYAPYYYFERNRYAQGEKVEVELAALALMIQRAELSEFSVDKGAFFEDRLGEYLSKNPGKSKDDFTPPVISMRGSRLLFPTKYACEWEFRCPVMGVEETSLCGVKLYMMTTVFVGHGDTEIKGALFASERILNGYVPKVGDDVQGILWMTGTIH